MRPTGRRILVQALIVCLIAPSAPATAEVPAVPGQTRAAASRPPASLEAFAEQVVGADGLRPARRPEGSFRSAIELVILAVICGLVAALYSASDGGRGSRRGPTRLRRR